MICDMSHMNLVSPRHRQIWTEFERRSEADLKRVLRGVGIVVTSGPIRGIVTAAYWMNPPVYPYEVLATWQQAYDWVALRLDGGV